MITDPIVDELDRQRAEEMARYNYDFAAFFRNLKEQESLSPRPVLPPPETPAQARPNPLVRTARG